MGQEHGKDGMTQNAEYVAALERECVRANILIGVLRYAASDHQRARSDEPFYTTYRDARSGRLEAWVTYDPSDGEASEPPPVR